MSKKSKLDQALAKLKKHLLGDAEYAIDHNLTNADAILDGFDQSDYREALKPLYEAALEEVRS